MAPGQSRRFSRVIDPIDFLTSVGSTLAALCLLGIFLLVAGEILLRNLFGYSLGFSWDVAGYLMGGCFMMAAASALKSGSHVRVTAITEMLPPRAARWVELAACLVGLAISIALCVALTETAILSYQRGSTSASVVRTPLVWPQSAFAIGAALLCLQMVAQALRVLRGEALTTGQGLE